MCSLMRPPGDSDLTRHVRDPNSPNYEGNKSGFGLVVLMHRMASLALEKSFSPGSGD
jgi:hypothetical protein